MFNWLSAKNSTPGSYSALQAYPKFSQAALLCGAILVNQPVASFAQIGYTSTAVDELEIVITAGRRPQQLANTLVTTEVLTREDIERRQSPDTFTLLESINGLTLSRTGGKGSVPSLFLRGTKTAQTLILLDGVRFNSAASGSSALDAIPVDSIERIEIVKGPVSSLYGADAAGGVIQIFTRKGNALSDKIANGQLSLSVGSHNTRRLQANGQVAFEQGHFHLSVQDESTDGFDVTGTNTLSGDEDPFAQQSANFSSSLYLSDNIRTQLSYLYSDSEIDFDRSTGESTRSFSTYILENTAANIAAQLSESLTLGINAGHLTEKDEILAYAYNSETARRSANTQITYSPSSAVSWISGIDYSRDEIEGSNFTESQENVGLYSQASFNVDAITLSFSGRTDENNTYGRNNTHSLSASYSFTSKTRLIASYGESFRAPTFNDLFFPGYNNPTLKPETGKSKEISLRHGSQARSWYINAYETQFDDLINYSFSLNKPVNVAQAEIEGTELGFSALLPANTNLNIKAAYTDARDNDSRAFLDGRAQWTVFSEIHWQAGKLAWGFDFQGVHGKRDQATILASYGLLGANVRYQLDSVLALFANLDNIGDRDYANRLSFSGSPYENAGRTVLFGFDLKI
jgi:vitamin B12 transporter